MAPQSTSLPRAQSPVVDEKFVDALLTCDDETSLVSFAHQTQTDCNTVEALKDYVARYHFSHPAFALRLAQQIHDISLHLPPPSAAFGHWALGNACLHNSEYVQAESHLAHARTQFLAHAQPLAAARLSVSLVGLYAYSGKFDEALTLASDIEPTLAQSAKTEREDLRRLASLPTNIGIVYELRGEYEEALVVYQRYLDTLIALGDKHLLARAYHNRAFALGQIGAFDEALGVYAEAEQLFQQVNGAVDLVRLYINRSLLLMSMGNYTQAQSDETHATSLLGTIDGMEQTGHRLSLLRAHLQLATARVVDQPVIDALWLAQQSFAAQGPIIEEGLAWLLLGRCYLRRHETEAAQRCFAQGLDLVDHGADRALAFRAQHGLAQVAEAEARIDDAVVLYRRALEIVELLRGDMQIETLRAAYLNDKLDLYRDFAALLRRESRLEEAFQVVERAKSRLISEKLAARLSGEVDSAASSGDEVVRDLGRRLQSVLRELDVAYESIRRAQTADDMKTVKGMQANVDDLERRVHALMADIQHRQPVFSPLTTGQTIALADMQSELKKAIFLQYHVTEGHYGVFVVDAEGMCAHVDLAPVEVVAETQNRFVIAIASVLGQIQQVGLARVERRLSALLDAVNKHLATLHRLLMQPLLEHLPPQRPLLIAPEGVLNAVPFHALYDGHEYLIEQRAVSYTPSATVFAHCRRRPSPPGPTLLLGYDDQRLDAIAGEVQLLAQLDPTAQVAIGPQATTDLFLEQAPHAHMIHVAAHAAFRRDKPMLSAIALADRRLALAEISRIQLNADLITLSGCETGVGALQGADLFSLATGFLGAGARSLLVSLWRVEDSVTAALMQRFYTALNQDGRDISYVNALRRAQLALLNEGRTATGQVRLYQHPAFWAAFFLLGNC